MLPHRGGARVNLRPGAVLLSDEGHRAKTAGLEFCLRAIIFGPFVSRVLCPVCGTI
jgi:hypothetical protein